MDCSKSTLIIFLLVVSMSVAGWTHPVARSAANDKDVDSGSNAVGKVTTTDTTPAAPTRAPASPLTLYEEIVSSVISSYPEPEKLKKLLTPRHVRYYLNSPLRALALWNTTATNKSEACRQYLEHLSSDGEGGCEPVFACNYDNNRFPQVLVKGSCTLSTCSKAENIDPKYNIPGKCVADLHNEVEIFVFSEEDNTSEEEVEGGSGNDAILQRSGKWKWDITSTPENCRCEAR